MQSEEKDLLDVLVVLVVDRIVDPNHLRLGCLLEIRYQPRDHEYLETVTDAFHVVTQCLHVHLVVTVVSWKPYMMTSRMLFSTVRSANLSMTSWILLNKPWLGHQLILLLKKDSHALIIEVKQIYQS